MAPTTRLDASKIVSEESGLVALPSAQRRAHITEIDLANSRNVRRVRGSGLIAKLSKVSDTIEFRVGTASWTDPTLVNSDLFYPPSVRSAEERLRFYAEQFNTVEVDSTFYALPAERNAKLWAERTPDGFVFNIKPFALMTQHPAEMSRLPNLQTSSGLRGP